VKKFLTASIGAMLTVMVVTGACATPTAGRQEELINLVKHDCGSCHGLTLKGGLGSALLPEQLTERPDEDLIEIILEGLADTPMPPWEGQLSEEEAAWIVQLLKKGVRQ